MGLNNIEKIFKAKNPSGLSLIFAMSILLLTHIYVVLMIGVDEQRLILDFIFWSRIVVIILSFTVIVITIIRMYAKPFTMQIMDDSLQVKNRNIKATDIKEIRVQGYFNPIIGILPKGKKITPVDLCFRIFSEQEDRAMEELTEWANQHQVKLSIYKQIKRWI